MNNIDFSLSSQLNYSGNAMQQSFDVTIFSQSGNGNANYIRNVEVPLLPTDPNKQFTLTYDVDSNTYSWSEII